MAINFNDFKVRCSSINDVLSESRADKSITEPQKRQLASLRKRIEAGKALTALQRASLTQLESKERKGAKTVLSDSCIKYLMIEYSWLTEGMIPIGKEQLDIVSIKKGNLTEQAGMLLLSEVDGVEYKTHKERIYNDFLSGEIDFYTGADVMNAICIADNKSSTDYPTYLVKLHIPIEKSHDRQIKGYMDITGASKGFVSHTLVDFPDEMVENLRWALTRKLGAATPESPEVLELWPRWVHSMCFSRIPAHKRVHKIYVNPFTIPERERVYDKVKVCREWLNNFHEAFQKKNL